MAQGVFASSSRRQFLGGLATAGAATMLVPGQVWAQSPKHHGVVDLHHHFWAPEYLKAQVDWENAHHLPHFPTMMKWTPEMSLGVMDKAGVETAVVSLASINQGFWGLDAEAASKVVHACDDYAAKMISDHPGRFGLFAPLSMVDIDTSLKEVEYGLDHTHAYGIGLQSSYNGKYPGDPFFNPIWEELNRRKTVVYLHGPNPACCSAIHDGPGMFPSVIEVTFDVTRAATSLLVSGNLVRYPNIKWVIAYGGGTLPFVAGRINNFVHGSMKYAVKAEEIAPHGVFAALRELYFDTVNVTNPVSWQALMNFAQHSHIVYGTDFPYFGNDQMDQIDQRHLPPKLEAAILAGNAKALLSPHLKA